MFHLPVNEGRYERLLRTFVAEALLIAAVFWTGGVLSVALVALAAVMAVTAVSGFCPLYQVLRRDTLRFGRDPGRWTVIVAAVIGVALAIVGSYYSAFFTRKFFLEDFSRMNQSYKQTLYFTGQQMRTESVSNYESLVTEHAAFRERYSVNRPFSLRNDEMLSADMRSVADTITAIEADVRSGDLVRAHTSLESVRPIYQAMLKRNGFSLLAVSLVDYHDSMEKVLDPSVAKDAAGVLAAYAEADEKMKAVEEQANDEEIQAMRASLEAVVTAARDNRIDELPDLGAKMKSSFVKVYLKRG